MLARGIENNKVHITGCPVFPEFTRKYPEDEITKLRQKHGIKDGMDTFLIMMGGNSVNKMKDMCEILLKRYPNHGVIAMAGANPKKINAIQNLAEKYPERLFTIPFTDEVAQYLAISHMVVLSPVEFPLPNASLWKSQWSSSIQSLDKKNAM